MVLWFKKHFFAVLIPAAALFLFYIGVSDENCKKNCNTPAEASIIHVELERRLIKKESSWKTVSILTIAYEAEGKEYRKKVQSDSEPFPSIGDTILIYYDPGKPHHFIFAEQYRKNLSISDDRNRENLFFAVVWIGSIMIAVLLDKKRAVKRLSNIESPLIASDEKKKQKNLRKKQIFRSILMMAVFCGFIAAANRAGRHSDFLLFVLFLSPFVLILIGIPILFLHAEKKEKQRCSVCVKGKIIEKKWRKEYKRSTGNVMHSFYFTVEYYDQEGNRYELSSDGGFSLPEEETFAEVWYNPACPGDAYLKGHHSFVWKVFGIFAIAVIAICGGIFAIALGRTGLFLICFITAIAGITIPVILLLKK